MWDPYAEFEHTNLPNGLDVYSAYWPGREWESVAFNVHSGSEEDPEGLEGIAHFVEHVVSHNTLLPQIDIFDLFAGAGGKCNLGTTNLFRTKYSFFAPTDKEFFGKALVLFGNMLLSARLERDVEQQRKVIIQEFHKRYPLGIDFLWADEESKILLPGYRLARTPGNLGTPNSICAISETDLQSFYDKHYTPNNISIVAVGGMTHKDLLDMLTYSSFAGMKPGKRTRLPEQAKNFVAPSVSRISRMINDHIRLDEPRVTGEFGTEGVLPAGAVNCHALPVLESMVWKRLFETMREKHRWTYQVKATHINYRAFHVFGIEAHAVAANSFETIESVAESILESCSSDTKLFEEHKRQKIAALKLIDTTAGHIRDQASYELSCLGRIETSAEAIAGAVSVTHNDIRDCLAWLTPERRLTVLVKP